MRSASLTGALALVPLILLKALPASAAPARPPRLVIAPVVEHGAAVAPPALMDQLYTAAVATAGLDVKSPAAFEELIVTARRYGLVCVQDDAACLARVAVLDELDLILMPAVALTPAGLRVTVSLLDAVHGVVLRGAPVAPEDVARAVAAVLDPGRAAGYVAVRGGPPGVLIVVVDGATLSPPAAPDRVGPLVPGPHTVEVEQGQRRTAPVVVEVSAGAVAPVDVVMPPLPAPRPPPPRAGPNGLLVGGLLATGAGGAVALAAGIGAVAIDARLGQPGGDHASRGALQGVGRALVATVAAALVVAAGGGAVAAVGALSE